MPQSAPLPIGGERRSIAGDHVGANGGFLVQHLHEHVLPGSEDRSGLLDVALVS